MAFRAAMTGHQVFTTLHTNSALGAFPRLLDIGIQPDIMAGNIIGVIAQRLVRTLCRHCRQPYVANAATCKLLGVKPDSKPPTLYRPVGCDHCDDKGYRGRLAIMELLKVDGGDRRADGGWRDRSRAAQVGPRQGVPDAGRRRRPAGARRLDLH